MLMRHHNFDPVSQPIGDNLLVRPWDKRKSFILFKYVGNFSGKEKELSHVKY